MHAGMPYEHRGHVSLQTVGIASRPRFGRLCSSRRRLFLAGSRFLICFFFIPSKVRVIYKSRPVDSARLFLELPLGKRPSLGTSRFLVPFSRTVRSVQLFVGFQRLVSPGNQERVVKERRESLRSTSRRGACHFSRSANPRPRTRASLDRRAQPRTSDP